MQHQEFILRRDDGFWIDLPSGRAYVQVIRVGATQVKLGITAPGVQVDREEVHEWKKSKAQQPH